MTKLSQWTILAACALGAHGAFAAEDTVNLNVRVNISAVCDISSASPDDVDFGTVASSATDVDAAGTLYVTCTPQTEYAIGLGEGENFQGGRRMTDGDENYVAYELYLDETRSQPWRGAAGEVMESIGTGSAQQFPVYGRIASANSPAGSYADIVLATVTY